MASGIFIKTPQPVKKSATLSLKGNELYIDAGEYQYKFQIETLDIEMGDSARAVFYLSSPAKPELVAFTSDVSLMADLRAAGCPAADSIVFAAQKKHVFFYTSISTLILLIGFMGYFLFVDRTWLVDTLANYVPYSAEEELGHALFTASKSTLVLEDHKKALTRFNRMVEPVKDYYESHYGKTIHVYLSESEVNNAFAMPGGIIVINRGLILQSDSYKELIGVLGHEIGHVEYRHSLKQLLHRLSTYVFISTLFGDLQSLATVANIGRELQHLSYSREDELQADKFGFLLLDQASMSNRGLIQFFSKGEAEANSQIASYFSTHPGHVTRVKALKKLAKDHKESTYKHRRMQIDFKRLKDILKRESNG